jgi:mannose-6-phosphate isomerase-like protein (cupin superfamily)
MAPELVEDPVLRQRYGFSREGDVVRVDVWVDPGGAGPLHFHPQQVERWEILEGEAEFRVGREKRRVRVGDRLVVEPGVRHAFANRGAEVAHLRAEVDPPLDIEAFLTEGAALNRSGRYTARGIPKGLRAAIDAAAFIERYRQTTVLLFPPRPVQRVLVWALAPFARRRHSGAAA